MQIEDDALFPDPWLVQVTVENLQPDLDAPDIEVWLGRYYQLPCQHGSRRNIHFKLYIPLCRLWGIDHHEICLQVYIALYPRLRTIRRLPDPVHRSKVLLRQIRSRQTSILYLGLSLMRAARCLRHD